jgi:hypothetical protein
LRKHAADEAEERRLAGLQPGDRRQPGTGGPDERQPDLLQRVAQPVGRPRVVADELRPKARNPYSSECVKGVFSEVRMQAAA